MGKLPECSMTCSGPPRESVSRAAARHAPSAAQAGQWRPHRPRTAHEYFRALHRRQRISGGGSSLWALGCFFETLGSMTSYNSHLFLFHPPSPSCLTAGSGRAGAGAGRTCVWAGPFPRAAKHAFWDPEGEALMHTCPFPGMEKERGQAEVTWRPSSALEALLT